MGHDASSFRKVLHDATRTVHDRLDALVVKVDLSNPADYARFLLASARALIPIEAWLDSRAAESVLPDWPRRRRSSELLADLADLHAPFESPARFTPAGADRSTLIGILYATEGSRLGATFLRRRVAPTILATRYLDHGSGESFWQSYLTAAASEPDLATDAMIAGALSVFECFTSAFTYTFPYEDTVVTP